MQGRVAAIYRHPLKSFGEEALGAVTLAAGQSFPGDRIWAVAHGSSGWDPDERAWVSRGNFVAQAHVPELARITVSSDPEAGRITLSHPLCEETTLTPDTAEGAAALTAWIAPLAEARRPGPYTLARLAEGALTDVPDGHVAVNSTASLAALETAAGQPLAHVRFRGNLWLDGLAAWEEFDLVGREITVGGARLRVTGRIGRCNATTASPETGLRDVQVPQILSRMWRHTDFGVYAQVVSGGPVALGDGAAA